MATYKDLYFRLFNTLTDALEASTFEEAKAILRQAQIDAEELFISDFFEENDT